MDAPLFEPLAAKAAARDGTALYFNASAVSLEGCGVLFLGPSAAGKSATALGLLAHGAQLISDDGVWLREGCLVPPEAAPHLIEARGIGLLNGGAIDVSAPLALVVDLGCAEDDRLPPRRIATTPDEKVTLIRATFDPTLVPALLQFLRHGRAAP
ncbi:HPr kinase/phosphorylase [Gymnodinialimonas ulvae]|uniref:HPr kinase/phosphorylase n=1 Tax=Gymnodinialimonas ulvae TaxID=3126504 RepID=UPI0030ACC901